MSESIGAEKLVQINGHFGVITSSTISNYVGLGSDWAWSTGTNTPAANDEDEIEVLGETGNYYFYIKSWDNDKDEVEAEIYNKVSLPDNKTAKDGSRGTPSIPAWNSGDWRQSGADVNSGGAALDAADIFDNDDGDRYDNLMFYNDGEFWYFMLFLMGDPYEDEVGNDNFDITYAVLMEDSANDGDYDYAVAMYRDTSNNDYEVRTYTWNGGLEVWQFSDKKNDCSNVGVYCRISKTDTEEHVAWAVKNSDSFSPGGDDFAKAVIHGTDKVAFGSSWADARNPTTHEDTGDHTIAATVGIPEFSTLLMPMASVILIVGYNHRLKRKHYEQH
jgi:hypothetical protein